MKTPITTYSLFFYRFKTSELDPEPNETSSRIPLKRNHESEYTVNYYYGARYYDPKVSVWLSVDPLATHPNQIDKSPYSFSWNNPIRYVDPDGRCPECEENVDNPNVGQTYESSGGQLYQYQETYDDDGNKTGAAWSGLGGVLAEVQVGPGADNSNAQGEGVPSESVGGLAVGGGMIGGLEEAYKRGNHSVRYGQKINGVKRSSAVISRANSIHAAKMAKGLKLTGRATAGLGIAAAGYEFYNSDKSGGDYARLAGAGVITATAFIPFVGPLISIGLGAADASGAFDGIYKSFDE